MAAIVGRIPAPVLARSTQSAARTYTGTGESWDFAIGGMPFNGAASEQRPLVRQTAPSRKEQSDQSREPGEHSLAFWWTKAQSSFHGGAGRKYLNPDENDGLGQFRFSRSTALDVFSEPGRATVVRTTARVRSSAGTPLVAPTDGGDMYVADGASLFRYAMTPAAAGETDPDDAHTYPLHVTVAWGGTTEILALAVSGSAYFLATADAIWRGEGSGAASQIYALPAGSKPLMVYVKQRLILVLNHPTTSPVYELDTAAASGTALPAALFSVGPHWTWTAITQTPNSILLAGGSITRSSVYRVNLETSGAVPKLLPGVVSAEFPPDEIVQGMSTYLSSVIGVQTTAGFRAGVLNNNGDFTYGALLFTHPAGAPSSAVFGADNSLYAGWQDSNGIASLARVDLTDVLGSSSSLRFPWAPHLQAMNDSTPAFGTVSSGTLWTKGRRVFVVPGSGVYVEHHTRHPGGGSLTTSRIRFGTLEHKVIRFLRVRAEGGSGRISVEVAKDSDENFTSVGAIDVAKQADSGDMYVQIPPAHYVTLRFTVTGDAALTGYQLKALPAQRRQRFLQLPLNCFDREIDNSGQVVGGDGTAMDRVLALEALEQSGDIISLQWLNAHPSRELTEHVTIESIEFAQTSGPSDRYGWGGIVTLTLRTVG